jgi:glycosyltransferase involved in cell wall biosynthesis
VFLKWLYRHIDHAFYVGTKNKEYLKEYGLKDGQLSFTPHAVDNERFAADRHIEAMALRDKLFIGDDDVLVLFAGKMEDKKSPLELLEAFLSLKKKGIHLLYAGNGDLESELKLKAAHAPNVHFLDFQNQTQMPVIYQACDLFCLPSKGPGETWGLAVNEAMACGKAVLISDKAGCCADLVKSDLNGQIFKSGNAQELKDCLDSLTQSKSKLAGMGRNSAAMIKDWSFANIADAIERKLSEQSTLFR